VSIWEVTTQTQLSKIKIPALPTAINASQDGKIIFVGTAAGILRIYDVSNRESPRLIKFYRFWEEQIPINCLNMSKDGEIILVSSPKSDLIYLVSTNCQISFNVKGHVKVDGYVQYSNFALVKQQLKVIACLSNNLLAGFNCPQ
jgi:WD40 repeat protein